MIANVKKCLFGDQTRGDSINTVVAAIIAEKLGLKEKVSVDEVAKAIVSYTNKILRSDHKDADEIFIKLIYGMTAWKAIQSNQELSVESFKPYTESTRYVFRLVTSLGAAYSLDYADAKISAADSYKITHIQHETEDPKVKHAKHTKELCWKCAPDTVRSTFAPYGELGTWMASVYLLGSEDN